MTFFKLLEDEGSYLDILKQNKMFVKNKAKVTVEEGPPPSPTKKTDEESEELKDEEKESMEDEEIEEKWMGPRGSSRDKIDARQSGAGDVPQYVPDSPASHQQKRAAYEKQRSKWNQEQDGVIGPHSKPEDEDSDDVS